jgi:hypothetical protein
MLLMFNAVLAGTFGLHDRWLIEVSIFKKISLHSNELVTLLLELTRAVARGTVCEVLFLVRGIMLHHSVSCTF